MTIDGSNTAGSKINVTVQVTDLGTSAWRVFNLAPGAGKTVSISNMTIKGGDISGFDNGGGILLASGTLNLANAKLSGSKAVLGGGIYNDGTVTVTNSTVSDCSAKGYDDTTGGDGKGGGVYNNSIATMTITGSTFSGCAANGGSGDIGGNANGGGFYNNGTAAITNSTFNGCSANGGSGYENGLGNGGGIFNDAGAVTIVKSTISGCSASNDSGGIYNNNNGTAYLLNTISIKNTGGFFGA